MDYFCLSTEWYGACLKFISMVISSKIIDIITSVQLPASTISLRSDGIMRIELHPEDEFTVNDTLEIIETVKRIGGGKKFPNLITTKGYINIDKNARALSASEDGNLYTIVDAIVTNSSALKLIADFYISFNKPVKPTRIFSSEEKAVEWLKMFL